MGEGATLSRIWPPRNVFGDRVAPTVKGDPPAAVRTAVRQRRGRMAFEEFE